MVSRVSIRAKIFLAVFSFALALVMGEMGARLLLPLPPRLCGSGWIYKHALGGQLHVSDPEIGWVLSPDAIRSRHRSVANDGSLIFDVYYSIENGQRLTSNWKVGGPKVICTGCSFTFGHGLSDEDTWPWLLQERLPDYHVVNVASMAYGTDQALLAAERQVVRSEHEARVVVVGFTDFQILRNCSSQWWLVHIYPYGKPLYVKEGDGVEYKGLVKFYALGSILGRSAFASHVSHQIVKVLRQIRSHDEAREVTVRLIIQWARQFESKGIDLVVVMLPWHKDHSTTSKANQTFVIKRLVEEKVHVLVPYLPRLSKGEIDGGLCWIGNNDRHPNRHYNMLIADQLSDFLKARVLGR